MSSQANDQGWILHSLAQSRRFGPMTEDELRGYFRAGMVKSVDRLSAPGDPVLRAAAEVAAMLGEAVPAGPPPPELTESPPSLPPVAAPVRDPANEDRAAKAAVAMNIDIAALMATSAPASRRSGWLLPAIIVLVMVMMLFGALRMLRNLKPPGTAANPGAEIAAPPSTPTADVKPALAGTSRSVPMPGAEAVEADAPGSADDLQMRQVQAEKLQNAGDWSGLSAYAQSWSQAQPERNEPLLLLGTAETRLGNQAQAIEAIQKVLVREPAHAGAQALLADAYLQAQRYAEAAALYGKLVAVSANDSRLWNNYGAALSGAGQPAQAVAALETAVRLDPGFKQAWTNLGNVYQSMGDSARASAAFANAR